MGLAVSIGKDNDELVDNLISNDSLKTEQIEKIMRLVDRGKFMTESAARENAYKDSAWKSETGEPGFLHLSAPCIYASVLENLHLEKGMSFLNVGSGTGYLSTMVGFILGESGINHGIELYENVVKFANERIVQFQNSKETSVFEWCVPEYFIGNAFGIDAQIKYDRIYCGALVPESHRAYFCSFLKVDGVLIMPYGHALQRITRKSDTVFNTRDISAVTFSHLIPINPENSLTNQVVKIPPIQLVALQSFCRNRIRHLIREALLAKQEVKMRLICNNKKPICRHGNDRNGEEAPTQQRETREEPVNEMGRLRARLFPRLNHPILLFERARREEEGNEDQDEAEENGPIRQPDQGRVLHMRHLLAMLARDRIQRHHAARANQAAQLPMPNQEEESDSEDEADELQLHNRDQGAQPQLYLGPDDNYFSFEFIPERDDDDDSNMAIGNFLDDAVDHNTNGTHEGAESEEIGIGSGEELGLSDLDVDESREVDAAENVEQEVTPNADQGSTVEENIEPRRITETDSNKNTDNEVDDSSSTASFATAQSDADIPLMEPLDVGTYDNNVNSVNNNNDEASKINSAKRQRTFTTNSSECAPQASKIKRESTSTTGFGGEAENEVFQPESANRVTDTEGSESPSSSSSKSAAFSSASSQSCCSCSNNEENKRENPDEVSSEEQAKQLQNFHDAFIKCIDSFPLTSQMRNFLKYQT